MNFKEWVAAITNTLNHAETRAQGDQYTQEQVAEMLEAALDILADALEQNQRFTLHPIGILYVRERQVSLFKDQPKESRPTQRFLSIRMSKALKARLNPSVIPDDRHDATPERTPDKPTPRQRKRIEVEIPRHQLPGRSGSLNGHDQPSLDIP